MVPIKHYGDICKIDGAKLPIVDIVTGGSPCQDLSVAGSRSGLAGERSGLFFEYIRVVKEMREHDRSSGRPDEFIRPRFFVFENVPGLLSSGQPKGTDFQTVLTEIVRIVQPEAPYVPMPSKGKWNKSGVLMGDGFSIAWRVFDSQYWGATLFDDEGTVIQRGTPQRRKRIALVADFSGDSAPEILFVKQSRSRNSEKSSTERETSPGDFETGSGESDESG